MKGRTSVLCRPWQGYPKGAGMTKVLSSSEGTPMKTHVRCGTLFSAVDQEARSDQTLVFDARGVLEFVGPTAQAPKAGPG